MTALPIHRCECEKCGSRAAHAERTLLGHRTATAGHPQTIRWTVCQLGLEFTTASLDGVTIHPRDLREQVLPTVAQALRFERDEPATLLLVQAAGQQVDLPMQRPLGMRRTRAALLTLTAVNRQRSHHSLPLVGRHLQWWLSCANLANKAILFPAVHYGRDEALHLRNLKMPGSSYLF